MIQTCELGQLQPCLWLLLLWTRNLHTVMPSGSERGGAKWREADLEWLGSKPSQVQTSMFEQGQEQPHAQEHDLTGVSRSWDHACTVL